MEQYEIHVTVRTTEIERFRTFCTSFNTKPIVLDLQNKDGEKVMEDVMTSTTLQGQKKDANNYMLGLAATLDAAGFDVVRMKIEGHPHCRDALDHHWRAEKSTRYFECHIPLIANEEGMEYLKKLAKSTEIHLSKNPLKVLENGCHIQMLTKRWYKRRAEQVEAEFAQLKDLLTYEGFAFYKNPHLEFVLHDSTQSHEDMWLGVEN